VADQALTRADYQDLRRLLLSVLAQGQRNSADLGEVMADLDALTAAVTAVTSSQATTNEALTVLTEATSTQEEMLLELKAIREHLELIVEEL
jgi:hypothetical protein